MLHIRSRVAQTERLGAVGTRSVSKNPDPEKNPFISRCYGGCC